MDQFLIHNVLPSRKDREEVWKALERLQAEGRVKSIGVSNWGIKLFEEGREYMKQWPPQCNQIELHPWAQQRELVAYLKEHGIAITAYCPIVRKREKDDAVLVKIAEAKGKKTTQVLMRWSLQKGYAPLPKSDNPDRIVENMDLFGFELSGDEMEALDGVRKEGKEEPCFMVCVNE